MQKFDTTNEAAVRSDLAHNSLTAIDGTVEQTSVAPAQLPELQAPDINDFLKDHGIVSGQDGSIGDMDLGNIGIGPDYGSRGNTGSVPGISGIPDFGGDPSDDNNSPLADIGDLGKGGSGGDGILGSKLPDGIGNGNSNDGPGLTLPGNGIFDTGHDGISGVGVPKELDGGGIRSAAVPGGIGSVGVYGFTASDFDNSQMTDSQPDGRGAKHATAYGTVGDQPVQMGSCDYNVTDHPKQPANCYDYDFKTPAGNPSYGATPPETHDGSALDKAWSAVKGFVGSIFGDDKPDPGKGNQPVDDSGAGHPGTHSGEQPVDDSGSASGGFHPSANSAEQPVDDTGSGGGFHPLTNSTAQPVDDSGTTPGHPGTHLGAVTADIASASHGASFSVAAPAAVTSTSTSNADSVSHTTQSISMGMFEHGALAPASFASIVDHATADVVTTTHSVDAHAEMNLSHHFELNLDISHLSAHAL